MAQENNDAQSNEQSSESSNTTTDQTTTETTASTDTDSQTSTEGTTETPTVSEQEYQKRLQRADRELVALRKKLTAFTKATDQTPVDYVKLAKENPSQVLQELGLDFDTLLDYMSTQPVVDTRQEPEDPREKELRELREYREQQTISAQKKQQEAVLREAMQQFAEPITANADQYPTLSLYADDALLKELVDGYVLRVQKDGYAEIEEILSDAEDLLSEKIEENLQRLNTSKRFQKYFRSQQKEEQTSEKKRKVKPTIGKKTATETERQNLSREERRALAVARLQQSLEG